MELKRTFEKGVMNKDIDERLVPNGYYTHAENLITDSTEGSDLGVIKNILSNKKVTDIDLGNNVRVLNGFSDETKQKIYYFVLSDIGSFLIEYDDQTQSTTYVLKDTRSQKVLNLKDGFPITSVRKIYNDDSRKDLLIWTNNDMEVCCINIERAKSYGENGFDKEDIFLIKKPPTKAPDVSFIQNNSEANEIEEKFILFATRYKYLDGEYSALSHFSYYNFIPKPFEVDFETLHNKAMVNNFNAVNVLFNTGDKRVTDIQIVAKFSNSETMYIVETLNKEKEGLNNDSQGSILYNNKKLYAALPEKELYRTFDNVPRKAKALTLIGNRIVLGNYTEGYNITDANNNKIKLSYGIDIETTDVNDNKTYTGSISPVGFGQSRFSILGPPYTNQINQRVDLVDEFPKHSTIEFNLCFSRANGSIVFQKLYALTLNEPIRNLNIASSPEVVAFFGQINADIVQTFTDDTLPNDIIITTYPNLTLESGSNFIDITLNPLLYSSGSSPYFESSVQYNIHTDTFFRKKMIGLPTSLKAYNDYEVGIVYQDEFKRSSTVLTSIENTKFIPFINTYTQNKLKLSVNHKPPHWAKYYRFAIKTKPMEYENIYINRFYVEDGFTWAKLEGDNKDKVKKNDELLVKKTANNNITKPIKIKVLDIQEKERDFIPGNKDDAGMDIIEEAGLYMKIKPTEFSMNLNDFEVKQTKEISKTSGTGNFPQAYVDLFTIDNNGTNEHFSLPVGSVIQLYIKSSNKPDAGWQDNILNKTYYVTTAYNSLGDWFTQNIINVTNLFGNEGNSPNNYHGQIELLTGHLTTTSFGVKIFTPDPTGRQYLRVRGTKPGMTQGRYGYLDVSLNVRTSDGFYVFETVPKKEVDLDIYYLDSETFEIQNGFHLGNKSNQSNTKPAVSVLNFFNCYTFGNGIESYKIRDGFNEAALNVDYSPGTTTIEEYKETVRLSDITWGAVYNESTNINGLNEFNTATINWKELDKQNGEIRLLHAREGNLLVIQEDKWGQVLFGKNAIYSADGNPTITTTNDVLRDYIPYAGTYGITDVESFITEANRCYAVDKKRGAVLRLSNDGINEITQGMNHWFKTTLQERNKAKIIGGYDPFYKTYNITIGEQPTYSFVTAPGQRINKYKLDKEFLFDVAIGEFNADVNLDYSITEGTVDLVADGLARYEFLSLTGQGTIEIPNEKGNLNISITPVNGTANIEIANKLISKNKLSLRTIVLASPNNAGLVFSNAYRNGAITYRNDVVLKNELVSFDETTTGQEGVGKIPSNGELVNIITYNDDVSTMVFNPNKGHKAKYLISSDQFDSSNFDELLTLSNTIDMNDGLGSFTFERNNENENIFLIYDLRSNEPLDIKSSVTMDQLSMQISLDSLFLIETPIESVIITEEPENALVALSSDFDSFNIEYIGLNQTDDAFSFNYEVTTEGIAYQKTLKMIVKIAE